MHVVYLGQRVNQAPIRIPLLNIYYLYYNQPLTAMIFRNFFGITSRNLGVTVGALGGSAGEFQRTLLLSKLL